ncbi:HdeD family acid-resistance protein [Caulobacter sp. UC70_42]|uniref:HdeD family acid-resistance protein n=1 Tax=Caulobacter sp. UC70_42 TaxID=3374551 RepID=UPI0037576440
MTTSHFESPFGVQIKKGANRLMWLGGALLVVGVAALVFPVLSTLVATAFVGWLVFIFGLATLFASFSIREAGPFFGALLSSLLSIAGGVFILMRPDVGALGLTICLGALFMVQGAFEMMLAFHLRPEKGWAWMLVSAVTSILLSLAIVSGLPGTSLISLGVILGFNFISTGVAYLFVGGTVKHEVRT